MAQRYFSLRQANDLLPMVREHVKALQELRTEAARHLQRLRLVRSELSPQRQDTESLEGERFRLESMLEFLQIDARTHLARIQNSGAMLKDIDMGLVDFPGLQDGEEVLWCWKLGEERITHYHGLHDGYAHRRPIHDVE